MAEAASSATVPVPAATAAPPATPAAAVPDVSDAIVGLTQQMAEAEPVEAEVDEPEQGGLDEKAGDEVIDDEPTDSVHSLL